MKYLKIANWSRWQNYRKDRGQPPWIKVHRCLIRNPDYVRLTDEQRGQLLGIWILAADKDGQIPDDPAMIAKICYMDKKPNLELFIRSGFIEKRRHGGVKVASQRQPHDIPETEAEKNISFLEFYGPYPRHVDRADAEKVWEKMSEKDQRDAIARVELLNEQGGWPESKFVKYPSSWLRKRRWEDELQERISEDERSRILGEPTFQ